MQPDPDDTHAASTETPLEAQELEYNELKNTGYEIFIAALSLLSIINLVLQYAIQDETLSEVIAVVNILLTLIFMMDFLYRFFTVRSKSHYFWKGFGWADLLASLPFAQVKIFRLFRLIKVVRLFREKGAKNVARSLIKDRAGNALMSLLLIAILMLEFGSLEMLNLEKDAPGSNITTASDSLWYIIVTMSTVGYGDQYPITNPGRVMGTIIIIIGVGIFGTLTGYLANLFLSPPKGPEPEEGAVPDAAARVRALKEMMAAQQAALDALEESLRRE